MTSGGSTGGTLTPTGGASPVSTTGGAAPVPSGGLAGTAGGGGSTAGRGGGGTAGVAGTGGSSVTGGNSGTGGAPAMVAFSQVMAFIRTQCGTCHAGTTPPNLNTTRGAAALHDTLLSTRISECAGNPLVTPGDPTKSALLMVGMGECGLLKMPAGCTDPICYTVADEALLTNWISTGAPAQ